MLVVTTITYILSFTIPLTVGLVSYFENSNRNHDNSPGRLSINFIRQLVTYFFAEQVFLYTVPIFIGVVSNPIIYGITNKMYREAYKKILLEVYARFCKRTETTQSTNSEHTPC